MDYAVIDNLEEIRRERGLTAKELSMRIGKDRNHWHLIRNKKRRLTLSTYVEISRILDVSPSKLLRECLNSNSR